MAQSRFLKNKAWCFLSKSNSCAKQRETSFGQLKGRHNINNLRYADVTIKEDAQRLLDIVEIEQLIKVEIIVVTRNQDSL